MKKPPIPFNENERQSALESYGILNSPPEEQFDDLTLIASQICNTPVALVSFVDKDRQWFKSKFGLSVNESHRDFSFCGHAINKPHQIFEVENAKEDDRFKDNPLVEGDPNIAFYAGVPLVNKQNLALGTLCVIDQEPKTLTKDQKKALTAVAKEVTKRIESFGKRGQLEKQLELNSKEIEQLKINNDRYLSLFDFAPLGIVVTDLSGNMVQTNQALEEMLGYTKVEFLGMSISSITSAEDIGETKQNIERLVHGEVKSFTMEKRYFSKNGETVWGRVSSSFVKNGNNAPVYLIAVIQNITEERHLAKKYELEKERLDLAFKGANDGIIDWQNINEDQQWWSPRFFELLGYKEGEISPNFSVFSQQLLHKEDYLRIRRSIQDSIDHGTLLDAEFRLRTKEGTYKWFRGKGKTNTLKERDTIRMTGSVSDIDHEKKLQKELLETQTFLKKITDIAPSIIYVFNQHTMSNEYVNREMGAILGYSDKEIKSLGSELMPTLCHPDDLELVFEHIHTISNLKTDEVARLEYRMKHKDGKYRWLSSDDSVFEWTEDGKVLKHIGVATDITGLKEGQEKLSRQAEVLKVQNQDLRQFAYVATHDLKNPLVTMDGHLRFIKNQFSTPSAEVAESIEFIEEELQNFTTTLDWLNEAIKLKEFKVTLESIDLNQLIRKTVPYYQRLIEELNGTLELNLDGTSKILGTKVYVLSILKNLLSNSIKYRRLDEELNVSVRTEVEKERLKLSISDNGLGIDLKVHQERIFKMFNRFHTQSEGSGMGLYMVKNMTEKLGGSIELESEVNKGTTFHVYFELEQ